MNVNFGGKAWWKLTALAEKQGVRVEDLLVVTADALFQGAQPKQEPAPQSFEPFPKQRRSPSRYTIEIGGQIAGLRVMGASWMDVHRKLGVVPKVAKAWFDRYVDEVNEAQECAERRVRA